MRNRFSFNPEWEALAVEAAKNSTCAKSKRGVVIIHTLDDGLISTGWNGPPRGFSCTEDSHCREVCNRVAVHAEERAILKASNWVRGADLIHIKVVDGLAVPSGGPSCWQCSRMMVEVGIATVWLKHQEGWSDYTAGGFHQLTLRNCNLLKRTCKHCGCELARELGGLESHEAGCPNFPL